MGHAKRAVAQHTLRPKNPHEDTVLGFDRGDVSEASWHHAVKVRDFDLSDEAEANLRLEKSHRGFQTGGRDEVNWRHSVNLRGFGAFDEVEASLHRKRVFDLVEEPEESLGPPEILLGFALLDQVGMSLSGMIGLPLVDRSIGFKSDNCKDLLVSLKSGILVEQSPTMPILETHRCSSSQVLVDQIVYRERMPTNMEKNWRCRGF